MKSEFAKLVFNQLSSTCVYLVIVIFLSSPTFTYTYNVKSPHCISPSKPVSFMFVRMYLHLDSNQFEKCLVTCESSHIKSLELKDVTLEYLITVLKFSKRNQTLSKLLYHETKAVTGNKKVQSMVCTFCIITITNVLFLYLYYYPFSGITFNCKGYFLFI